MELPALTKDIFDNGIILVYLKSGSIIFPLPYSYFSSSKNMYGYLYSVHYNSASQKYTLRLYKRLEAINNANELIVPEDTEYKIILANAYNGGILKSARLNELSLEEAEKLILNAEKVH